MVLEKQFVVNGFGIKEFNGGKVYLELPRYQSYYNPKMSGAFSRGLIKISEWNDRSKSGGSLSVLESGKKRNCIIRGIENCLFTSLRTSYNVG